MSGGKFRRRAAEAGGFDGVAHEHGDGHGANAAGDGSERSGNVDGARMDVADEGAAFGAEFLEAVRKILKKALSFFGVGDAVGANIDDRRAGPPRRGRFDPVRLDIAGFAHGGNHDVGAAEDAGQIARFGMANRDRGIGVHEEQSHGFSDDVAAAEDDSVGAFDLDFIAAQNFHAAGGSASYEAGASADEAAEIDGMETVNVLGGIDGFQDALGVHLWREGKLDENAVDVVVAIEVFDDGEEIESANRCRWREERAGEAELFAGCDFTFHVDLRSGIFADQNSRQPRANSRSGEQTNLILQLGEDLVPNFGPIKDPRGHSHLAFFAEPRGARPGKLGTPGANTR